MYLDTVHGFGSETQLVKSTDATYKETQASFFTGTVPVPVLNSSVSNAD
jgi:hypothetical protein